MSKTTAPLLSFGAGGQLAKTMVYSSWKGIPYARRYTVPANPNTQRQQVVRSLFKTLQSMWLLAPGELRDPFTANATGRPYTPNNKFTSANIEGVDTEVPPTDFAAFVGSPGALGGLPSAGLVLTPAATQITAALTAPQIPSGWTITQAVAILFPDQDPQADFVNQFTVLTDAVAPYSLVFTGLDAATDYVVSAWFEWLRPDGRTAYSPSLTDIGTTP